MGGTLPFGLHLEKIVRNSSSTCRFRHVPSSSLKRTVILNSPVERWVSGSTTESPHVSGSCPRVSQYSPNVLSSSLNFSLVKRLQSKENSACATSCGAVGRSANSNSVIIPKFPAPAPLHPRNSSG